jgi:hypothetical protein
MKGTLTKRNKTMKNQINLKDGETLTWAIYENGSGVLSLVLFAETIAHARPVAAVFDIFPFDVAPALEDLEMISMWQGVNYDVADIQQFLRDEATRPVAYSTVIYPSGGVETIMEIERMGYAARKAFNIANE